MPGKIRPLDLLPNRRTFFSTKPIRQPKPENLSAKEYICRKFKADCATALKVVKLESNFNQYAINKNKDGSLDLGMWQINEKYQKVSRKEAFDPILSTEVAYNIYKSWGNSFEAWSAYKKIK